MSRATTWETLWARREVPWLVAVVSLVLLVLLVAPLATPVWWDAGAVYAPGARWLAEHGFDARPGAFPEDLSRGHTPLFFLFLGADFRIFGPAPLPAHVLALAFGWMALVYVYALGAEIGGRRAGVAAAALLVASPLFETMASECLDAGAITALTAAALYAFAKDRMVECAVWGSLLVLFKETGVACPLAIGAAVAWRAWRSGAWRPQARRALLGVLPIVFLAMFFFYQRWVQGWFILPYHAGLFRFEHSLTAQLVRVAASIVFADGRGVAVVGAAIAFVVGRRRDRSSSSRAPSSNAVLVALALHALMNLAFFTKMFFLERYTLPVHVDVVVVVAALLVPARASHRSRLLGLLPIGMAVAIGLWRRDAGSDVASGETSFRYLHAVRAYEALYGSLEAEGGDPVVLTDWPVTDQLRDPYLGWVGRPFRAVDVGSYYGNGSKEGPIDRIIAVPGLSSYGRLEVEAGHLRFHLLDRRNEGPAAIELWGR